MSITDKLTYTYNKRIKRWIECPICHKKMTFRKQSNPGFVMSADIALQKKNFLMILYFGSAMNAIVT